MHRTNEEYPMSQMNHKVSDNRVVGYCIRFQMPDSLDYHRILGSKRTDGCVI